MAAQAGWQCICQIGATPATIGNLTQADLVINGQVYDVTQLGHQWMDKLGGLADYTLKLAGNWDLSDAQQATLQGDIITNPGTVVTWDIAPKGTVATTRYAGTAIIKTQTMKFAVNAKEDVAWDMEGTGAITFTA